MTKIVIFFSLVVISLFALALNPLLNVPKSFFPNPSQQLPSVNAPGPSFAYDFFYFVQQWPGSVCATKEGCCYPKSGKPPSDFGIHGLWPNFENGTYPASCDPNNPFNLKKIQNLVGTLNQDWPSLACPSSDSTPFWKHEWNKHGTCSETVLDQHSYFQASINLKNAIKLLHCLKSANITPSNGSYALASIKLAIDTCVGHNKTWIQCRKNKSGHDQLFQVYTCVDHSGTKLIDCPIFPSGSCNASILFPKF